MKLTVTQFKRKAEAAFLKRNPGAKIEWVSARKAKCPTGVMACFGTFAASGNGYRPRIMSASGDDEMVMVR